MGFSINTVLKVASVSYAGLAIATPTFDGFETSQYGQIIERDVCIIGGGSSGTFAAIQLKDKGKSVVVVEAKDKLGGHTQTYTDPATGQNIDYGVMYWHDIPVVRDYFARLNVSLAPANLGGVGASGMTKNFDFDAGVEVTNYTATDPSAAFQAYGAQLAKYPYVDQGFELPDPVPEDLLLPFGDFVTKYSLQDLVQFLFRVAQGLGDLLAQPTLYVFKNFGTDLLRIVAQGGFLTTKNRNNYELYDAAQRSLGADNILFNSTVVRTNRNTKGRSLLVVRTPAGLKLILAKQILLTIPPKLANLRGWDLSRNERRLFSQFTNSAYYTSVVRDAALPANTTFFAVGASTPYQLAPLPGVYVIVQTSVPGLFIVLYGAAQSLSDERVQADILDAMRVAAGASSPSNATFAAYSNHNPFELAVSPNAIRDRFYRELYGLQGERSTFYTGAAFHTHDSSLLWNFTQAMVLPKMVG